MKSLAVTVACLTAISVVNAEPALTTNDIARIKRICRQFYDTPARDMQATLRSLLPYLRSQDALKNPWVCSSQYCRGSVALRGGAGVVYGFISIPDPSTTDSMEITPDAVRKGNNRINAVGLLQGGKVLFAIPANAAPFLTRTSSNQAMKPTASMRSNDSDVAIAPCVGLSLSR